MWFSAVNLWYVFVQISWERLNEKHTETLHFAYFLSIAIPVSKIYSFPILLVNFFFDLSDQIFVDNG